MRARAFLPFRFVVCLIVDILECQNSLVNTWPHQMADQSPIQQNGIVDRRKMRFSAVLLGLLIAAFVGGAIDYTLFFGVVRGPTLIEQLRNGDVTRNDISRVELLRARLGYWEFSEAEYDCLQRITLPSAAIDDMVSILAASTAGHKSYNHPACGYKAILKFHFQNGEHCYLLYNACRYHDDQHHIDMWTLMLNSLPVGTTNPNGGKSYESVPLAYYLDDYDPWWQKHRESNSLTSQSGTW